MDPAAVVLVLEGRRATDGGTLARSALAAGCDPVVIVLTDTRIAANMPSGATVLADEAIETSEGSALRVGIDWCLRAGAEAVLVAVPKSGVPAAGAESFARLFRSARQPIVVGTVGGRPSGLVRVDPEAFGLLPIDGPLAALWERHRELVEELALDGEDPPIPGPVSSHANEGEIAAVAALLGRAPAGAFRVVVTDATGGPVVIENAPFLDDGTPMPTRYWLVGRREREAVGRLESAGGVAKAEAAVGETLITAAHERYAALREAAIPPGIRGPRPSGGVGGTRRGVKCLHAHLAWYLAGGADPVGRWVVDRLSGLIEGPVAAVDCGTNSTRLLVLDRNGAPSERRMTITRLGEGVDRTGRLSDAALDRTLAALAEYRGVLDSHGVVRVRAIATSAARDAENAEEFFSRAEAVLGVRPELISGEEEGRTAYLGATASLDPGEAYLVLDIGGGSTELIAGPTTPAGDPAAVVSLAMGCVRVTERFFSEDPPNDEELTAARSFVTGLVTAALEGTPAFRIPRRLVGVAGTVSTLAHLELGLDHHDPDAVDHLVLSRDRIEYWLKALAGETVADRRKRPGIEHDRADVIVGGLLVLDAVMEALGRDALICSESDILDGVAAGLRVS